MGKPRLELISPAKEKRTVAPRRRSNRELRPREHLTELEVAKLIEVAKRNRHGQRDATMILICFRHGLRASELCELQWSDLEFETATLHLRRTKNGTMGTHPLLGDELRALRVLKREAKSPFIFVSERGAPFTVSGLQKLVERAGIATKIPFKVHPHMLRHAVCAVRVPRPSPWQQGRRFVRLSYAPTPEPSIRLYLRASEEEQSR